MQSSVAAFFQLERKRKQRFQVRRQFQHSEYDMNRTLIEIFWKIENSALNRIPLRLLIELSMFQIHIFFQKIDFCLYVAPIKKLDFLLSSRNRIIRQNFNLLHIFQPSSSHFNCPGTYAAIGWNMCRRWEFCPAVVQLCNSSMKRNWMVSISCWLLILFFLRFSILNSNIV